jgi:hypothetical protein
MAISEINTDNLRGLSEKEISELKVPTISVFVENASNLQASDCYINFNREVSKH